MAEKEFLLGVKARELLKHTKRETRVVTDDISPQDVRVILHKIAALEDIRDAREVCSQAINAVDRKRALPKAPLGSTGRICGTLPSKSF